MQRPTPKQVRAIVGTTALAVTLLALDVWAAMRLVRGHLQLPVTVRGVESICPIDDERGEAGRSLLIGTLERLSGATLEAMPPCRSELHVPHERMLELSPFPPLLAEIAARSSGPTVGSAVLDTTDDRRVQMTVIYGPADRTPSRFVPRAPGEASFAPAFRVTYLFLHEPGPTLQPRQHFAAWTAVEDRGDGGRIVALVISFATAEVCIAMMMAGAYLRGRRRGRAQPTMH